MNENLMNRYPAVAHLAHRARRRIPHFAWEYLDSGTTNDECVQLNRDAFAQVKLVPQFMKGEFTPDISTSLFGTSYAAPFGIAPVGLTGLMWPRAEQILARTAARYRIPFTLSTVATEAPETIGPLTEGRGWFQLYPPRNPEVRRDLLARARDAGFTALLVTADVPANSRRERQLRAGVRVPPKLTPLMLYRCAIRPRWTAAVLQTGTPRFRGLERYASTADMREVIRFVSQEFGGTLDWDYMQALRDEWHGPILIKGVLDIADAQQAVAAGLDGIVVSNHGGRQFDGAPASISVLPAIARAVDGRIKVLFDSGVRNGLDIARALALGADFVLLGRAFMLGVAALGQRGGDHVAEILRADLICNMSQLGCKKLDEIATRLA